MTQAKSMLKRLFSSNLRVKVLSYLFFHPEENFYVRGLAAALEESAGTLARELSNLESAGIVVSRKVGNQKHYSLNEESPIHEDLRNLFLKTTGAGEEIRSALEKTPGIELVFIYGSFASGEAGADSDIDLMVVGEASDKELAPVISHIERRLKREINYTLFTRREVEKRLRQEGDFIHEVFSRPRILLVGKADDRRFRAS